MSKAGSTLARAFSSCATTFAGSSSRGVVFSFRLRAAAVPAACDHHVPLAHHRHVSRRLAIDRRHGSSSCARPRAGSHGCAGRQPSGRGGQESSSSEALVHGSLLIGSGSARTEGYAQDSLHISALGAKSQCGEAARELTPEGDTSTKGLRSPYFLLSTKKNGSAAIASSARCHMTRHSTTCTVASSTLPTLSPSSPSSGPRRS